MTKITHTISEKKSLWSRRHDTSEKPEGTLLPKKHHSDGQNNQAPSEKSITPMVKIIKLLPRKASLPWSK